MKLKTFKVKQLHKDIKTRIICIYSYSLSLCSLKSYVFTLHCNNNIEILIITTITHTRNAT